MGSHLASGRSPRQSPGSSCSLPILPCYKQKPVFTGEAPLQSGRSDSQPRMCSLRANCLRRFCAPKLTGCQGRGAPGGGVDTQLHLCNQAGPLELYNRADSSKVSTAYSYSVLMGQSVLLYGRATSSCSFRVRIALNLAQVSYETISPTAKEQGRGQNLQR